MKCHWNDEGIFECESGHFFWKGFRSGSVTSLCCGRSHLSDAWSGVLCLSISAVCLWKITGILLFYEQLMEKKKGGQVSLHLFYFLSCV